MNIPREPWVGISTASLRGWIESGGKNPLLTKGSFHHLCLCHCVYDVCTLLIFRNPVKLWCFLWCFFQVKNKCVLGCVRAWSVRMGDGLVLSVLQCMWWWRRLHLDPCCVYSPTTPWAMVCCTQSPQFPSHLLKRPKGQVAWQLPPQNQRWTNVSSDVIYLLDKGLLLF